MLAYFFNRYCAIILDYYLGGILHHIVRKRREHQAYTLHEVAEHCCVSVGSLQWHKMKGRIPEGEITVDRYNFFSKRQLEVIKTFFDSRAIYEHMH